MHEREAAAADEQRQRRDDRLDPDARDQHPVDEPDERAADERDRDRDQQARSRGTSASRAEAIAMTEPTDRSIPRVPMTSAMPSAMIATGTTWTNCSRMLSISAKRGVNTRLKAISSSSPT